MRNDFQVPNSFLVHGNSARNSFLARNGFLSINTFAKFEMTFWLEIAFWLEMAFFLISLDYDLQYSFCSPVMAKSFQASLYLKLSKNHLNKTRAPNLLF